MGDSVVAEEPLAVGVRVTEPLDVGVAVIEAVGVGVTGDPLAEGLAPSDKVAEGVTVLEGVPVGDTVPVGETVGEPVGVAVEESEGGALLLAVFEGLAPRVREAVGDADTVLRPLTVVEGVEDGVGVGEVVVDAVGGAEGVLLDVLLTLRLALAVLEGDAPRVREEVRDADSVLLPLLVVEGVGEAVPVGVGVG